MNQKKSLVKKKNENKFDNKDTMKIYIGSDHAGFKLKEYLINYLQENGVEIEDVGPFGYDPDDDYPDLISLVAAEVSKDPKNNRGIVIGYSGQGEALVANKFKDVRAGLYYGGNLDIVKLMREHNDANVLSLGAHFVTEKEATQAVDMWIDTQFSKDIRHVRRIEKIKNLNIHTI